MVVDEGKDGLTVRAIVNKKTVKKNFAFILNGVMGVGGKPHQNDFFLQRKKMWRFVTSYLRSICDCNFCPCQKNVPYFFLDQVQV